MTATPTTTASEDFACNYCGNWQTESDGDTCSECSGTFVNQFTADPSPIPPTLKAIRDIGAWSEDSWTLLTTAGTFAMFTVQDNTAKAEARLVWWHENGRPIGTEWPDKMAPRFPNSMFRNLTSLHALTSEQADHVRETCLAGDYWTAVQFLMDSVVGLNVAKSCFTLALTGWAPLACLDSHAVSKLPGLEPFLTASERKSNSSPGNLARYILACEYLSEYVWNSGSDHASGQWTWWFANAVTYTDHSEIVRVLSESA